MQWDLAISMLGAASMALLRRRIPGAPCVPDDECNVDLSRWTAAWNILRAGLVSVRRSASEGVEALKLELQLYSAALGRPALVGFQYVVDRYTPLRLEAMLEEVRTSQAVRAARLAHLLQQRQLRCHLPRRRYATRWKTCRLGRGRWCSSASQSAR